MRLNRGTLRRMILNEMRMLLSEADISAEKLQALKKVAFGSGDPEDKGDEDEFVDMWDKVPTEEMTGSRAKVLISAVQKEHPDWKDPGDVSWGYDPDAEPVQKIVATKKGGSKRVYDYPDDKDWDYRVVDDMWVTRRKTADEDDDWISLDPEKKKGSKMKKIATQALLNLDGEHKTARSDDAVELAVASAEDLGIIKKKSSSATA